MKYTLIGLILVLAGVLWFLMPAREGLDNPAGCPTAGQGITSVKQSGGQNVRLYTQSECKGLGGNWAGNGLKSWGMKTDLVGECYGIAGINVSFCNQSSPPSSEAATAAGVAPPAPAAPAATCPTNGEGITSVTQSGGQNVRLYTQPECTALKGNWVGNGKKSWGMQTDMVGECIGVPGQNIGFCNQTAPPSAAAKAIESPAPAPPPPPPAAPLATASAADSQMGTLISLLQQDIMGRQSSLLNTANNPAVPVGSLLTQTTVDPNWKPIPNATIPGPNFSGMNSRGPLDEIPKSSLVPCTCPTYTMSCPVHAGSQPSSQAPGDADSALSRAQDQYDMMRPFNKTDDVPGFLNTFSNFGN